MVIISTEGQFCVHQPPTGFSLKEMIAGNAQPLEPLSAVLTGALVLFTLCYVLFFILGSGAKVEYVWAHVHTRTRSHTHTHTETVYSHVIPWRVCAVCCAFWGVSQTIHTPSAVVQEAVT